MTTVGEPDVSQDVSRRGGFAATFDPRRAQTTSLGRPRPSAVLKLRWLYPVLGGLIFAILACLLSVFGGSGEYRSTAILQTGSNTQDSTRVTQMTAASAALAQSSTVLTAAAKELGLTLQDLRDRTDISTTTDEGTSAGLVQITVQAPQAAQAVRQANEIADQVIAEAQALASARQSYLLRSGNSVTQNNTLADKTAETSRLDALGEQIAQQQGAAIASGADVSVLSEADEASQVTISTSVALILGAVGGILLGALLALGLGIGRHKLANDSELAILSPDLAHRSTLIAAEEAGRVLTERASGLVVLSMPGSETEARAYADQVSKVIAARGLPTNLHQARSSDDLKVLNRAGLLGEPIQVVLAGVDGDTLAAVAGQLTVRTLIVVPRTAVTLHELRSVAAAVATTSPRAVVTS